MSSLRNRIAALLIVAIISVVALATLAAQQALQPPSPSATVEPLARHLELVARVVEQDPSIAAASGVELRSAPDAGKVDEGLSHFLQRAFAANGSTRTAIVSRDPSRPSPVLSVTLSNGRWLVTDLPDMGPPPDGWKIFGIWIAIIVIGSTIVSIFTATKIVRPLTMLESAASRLGPDGALPHIPETGSAEIRATARALNGLSARLKAAMESRLRVVAAAGHDLRTPMTRMRLRAEFITDDEERDKWLSDLTELDAIADSAIRLVREEVDRDATGTVDLNALVSEIVSELQDIGHDNAVTFTGPSVPVHIEAAPLALKRALRNLAMNAVTHGKGAEIVLRLDATEAVIVITDKGSGIPEEMIGRVFEPFFRVDPARRKSVPGAGLGLAIAKEIIERLGGRISIANRKPNGLVQTVTFRL